MNYEIKHGECLDVLRGMPDNSVDSVVTDPPYGLAFMGKKWDYDVPTEDVWRECLRVLKPGGHLLAFAGTRTQHRMAVRIEDAGFEIRDMIAWVYGSGFPKSHDVSKAIDREAGAKREVVGMKRAGMASPGSPFSAEYQRAQGYREKWQRDNQGEEVPITAPATSEAQQWAGWGTALKPALEPITVARKPFTGTVAANVLEHGTGALNIDGCRVGAEVVHKRKGGFSSSPIYGSGKCGVFGGQQGRWPANLIHDGSEEVVKLFPETGASNSKATKRPADSGHLSPSYQRAQGYRPHYEREDGHDAGMIQGYGDTGSAARFFYCAKASKRDRDGSTHPTMKPTDLMRYLCRLVTPPGGIVLDPFAGSGSTGKGAVLEGFQFIGIEREAEYVEIARARIAAVAAQPVLL
jgi:DNA modification methylase